MRKTYFITGIGTEVGKTVVSAIFTEALKADYWKPIQAGDLDHSDTKKLQRLVTNKKTVFHPNSYALTQPMSPHAAAALDQIHMTSEEIREPSTKNHLVIEGAGGLLVPLSDSETILDLVKPEYRIILVSRHYLGSINHTLLSLEVLKNRGLDCFGIVFSGPENKATEEIIQKMSQAPVLGRIDEEPYFDANVIREYAELLRNKIA